MSERSIRRGVASADRVDKVDDGADKDPDDEEDPDEEGEVEGHKHVDGNAEQGNKGNERTQEGRLFSRPGNQEPEESTNRGHWEDHKESGDADRHPDRKVVERKSCSSNTQRHCDRHQRGEDDSKTQLGSFVQFFLETQDHQTETDSSEAHQVSHRSEISNRRDVHEKSWNGSEESS